MPFFASAVTPLTRKNHIGKRILGRAMIEHVYKLFLFQLLQVLFSINLGILLIFLRIEVQIRFYYIKRKSVNSFLLKRLQR